MRLKMKNVKMIWNKIESNLAGVCIFLALAISFTEVITRYFFGYSSFWAHEYILYFVVWSVFLGASQVLSNDKHVKLEIFVGLLPQKGQKIMGIFTAVLVVIFGILFLVSGLQLVMDSFTHNYVSTSLAKTPIWIPQLICPLAGILFTFRGLENVGKKIKELKELGEVTQS